MLAPQRSAPSGTCLAMMPVPLDTATDGNDEARERRKTTSKYRGIGSSRGIAAVRVGRRSRRIGDMNELQVRSVKQQACLRDVVPGRPAAGGAWRCTQRVGALRASARKPDSAQPKRCAQRAADAGRYRSRASRVAMDHAARVEPRATRCQRACAAPSPRNGNGFAGRNAAETSPLNVLRCSLPRSRRLIGVPAAKSTFLRSIQNVFGVSADSKK